MLIIPGIFQFVNKTNNLYLPGACILEVGPMNKYGQKLTSKIISDSGYCVKYPSLVMWSQEGEISEGPALDWMLWKDL